MATVIGSYRVEIDGLQEFFLSAMADGGYASKKKMSVRAGGLPGETHILFSKGKLTLVDRYFTKPYSDKSSGQTIILTGHTPLWVMSYEGFYEAGVIHFLKLCLAKAYSEDRFFYGGRGPFVVTDTERSLAYINDVAKKHFSDFEGKECIISNGRVAGYHRYRGMLLY